MSLVSSVALVGVLVAAAFVAKAKLAAGGGDDPKFKAKTLLTANELEFVARLEAAVPELRICPQVAMGAILDPAVARSDAKAFYRARGMFAQKIVDFVAQDRADGRIVAVIELDDRTHDGEKDARRDAMLKSAGYRVVRWSSKSKPDAAAIRAVLVPPSTPVAQRQRIGMALSREGGDDLPRRRVLVTPCPAGGSGSRAFAWPHPRSPGP